MFLTFLIPTPNTQGGMRTENVLRDHCERAGLVQAGNTVLVAVWMVLSKPGRGVQGKQGRGW